jgi:hypothetical protein
MTDNRDLPNRFKILHYGIGVFLLASALQCTSADGDAYDASPSIPNRYFEHDHGLHSWPLQDDDLLKSDIHIMGNDGIDSLLRVLLKRDQEVRIELGASRGMVDNDSEKIITLGKKMKKIDDANFILLSRIFDKVGWPSNRIFSDSAVNAAFYVTLHHTRTDLSHLSTILENAFTLEQIDRRHYAVLVDRILIRKGLTQKYGTHCRQNRDGSKTYISLEDPVSVAKNRESIGLKALDQTSCELIFY